MAIRFPMLAVSIIIANIKAPMNNSPKQEVVQSSLMHGSAADSATSTARFTQKPMVKFARLIMSRLDRIAPSVAARLTYQLISSPPRHKPRVEERNLRARAAQSRIAFQGGWLQCYQWGKGPLCLFVHCWGGRGTQAQTLIEKLVQSGLSVVSFDHPAHGLSSGTRAEMIRMSAATAAVVKQYGAIKTVIGHSLGVAAVTIAMRDYDLPVARLVSISSLTDCIWFTRVIGGYLGISNSTLSNTRALVDRDYAQPVQWEELSVQKMIAKLSIPILLIHDRDDHEIPFAHSVALHQAAPHATFFETNGEGHRRILKNSQVIEKILGFIHHTEVTK